MSTFHPSRDAEHNAGRQRLYEHTLEDLRSSRNHEIRRMLEASKRVHDLDEVIAGHEAVLGELQAEASTHNYAKVEK